MVHTFNRWIENRQLPGFSQAGDSNSTAIFYSPDQHRRPISGAKRPARGPAALAGARAPGGRAVGSQEPITATVQNVRLNAPAIQTDRLNRAGCPLGDNLSVPTGPIHGFPITVSTETVAAKLT